MVQPTCCSSTRRPWRRRLRRIFASPEGFDADGDLLQWMRRHSVKPSASYVNSIGRTVRQIREEDALHQTLTHYLAEHLAESSTDKARDLPQQIRDALIGKVREHGPPLTVVGTKSLAWRLRRILYLLVPVVLIVVLPALVLPAHAARAIYAAALLITAAAVLAFLVLLRRHETRDPDVQSAPIPPSDAHLLALTTRQDHDVTNQYTAFGSFKPDGFRAGRRRRSGGWSISPRRSFTRMATWRGSRPSILRTGSSWMASAAACSSATTTAAPKATWTTSSTRSRSVSI